MEGGSGRGGAGGSGPIASAEFYLPNYRLGKTVGFGSFGKVKVAEHVLTQHKVAIKILNRRRIRALDMEEKVRREIKILRLFMHPHIIRLYEVIETPTDIFVVMEYVKSGELFDYIVDKGRLLEDEARRFFQQIISGVEYCHRNMVAHRDLKPENLLLDSRLNVKIADFGLSNIMRDGHFLRTSCGSPNYAAPEVISGKLYSGPEVDVWSCGVILYALLCGSLPFDDESIPNLFKKIKGGIYTLPSYLSPGARDLISRVLVVDPLKRITIPEIRQHPWFQAHLQRYLAVPPPDTNQQAKRIDDDILQAVLQMGFDRNQLVESLHNRVQNKATVAYYLMLDNRRRISNGYLGAEFQEGREELVPAAHVHPNRQIPVGRPDLVREGFAPGTVNNGRGLSPSCFQGRVVADQKWSLGLQSRATPIEIMMEVLKALHELEITWKKLGNYSLKCRWVAHVASSEVHRSNSDSPMVTGSLGSLPKSPMLPGSPQQGVNSQASPLQTRESEDGTGGEEHHKLVKFEVQLYKVKDDKFLLDLQRVEGPYLLFLDLCASFLTELQIV